MRQSRLSSLHEARAYVGALFFFKLNWFVVFARSHASSCQSMCMGMVSAAMIIEMVRGVPWYSGWGVYSASRLPVDGFDIGSAFHTLLEDAWPLLLNSDTCGYLFDTCP